MRVTRSTGMARVRSAGAHWHIVNVCGEGAAGPVYVEQSADKSFVYEQVSRRHGASSEEVLSNPTVRFKPATRHIMHTHVYVQTAHTRMDTYVHTTHMYTHTCKYSARTQTRTHACAAQVRTHTVVNI